jgi:predicted ATPase
LQWCDPETLAWLHHLLRFDPAARLLVVGTVRTEEMDADHPLLSFHLNLRSAGLLSELELAPLSAAQTADLANQVAERPLAQVMLEQVVQTSEGNPLFVTESVRAALGTLWDAAQESGDNIPAPMALPAKVQAVIQQRLARLSPGARELASVAAVIGRSFTVPVLAQASGLDEDELVRGLDELWQRRVVREQGDEAYDFSHDRIRETAYAGLSLAHRRLLHRRVAEALEQAPDEITSAAAQVAFHYEQAGLVEQAVAHYSQAAAGAHQVYAFDDAVGYLTKALALLHARPATPARVEQEVDLLSALGAAWSAARTWAASEAQEAYDRAYALSRDLEESPRLFTALWGLHEFHLFRSEYERALDTATACLRIAQRLQDPVLRLQAHHAMWGVLSFMNRYAAALEHTEQGLALYDRHLHQPLAFHYGNHDVGHCGLSIASIALWMSGFPDKARQRLQMAIQLAQELSLPLSQAEAYYNHAHIYQLLGEPLAVRTWAEATVTLSRQHGFRYCLAIGSAFAGWAMAVQGEHQTGLEMIRQGMAIWEREGMRYMQTYLTAIHVEAHLAANQIDQALTCVAEGQAFAIEFNEHFFEPELYRLQGEVLTRKGALPQQIEKCYQQALALARQQEAKMLEVRAAISLARLWQQQGRRSEAHALLAGVYFGFREGFTTPDLQEAQVLLAALAS